MAQDPVYDARQGARRRGRRRGRGRREGTSWDETRLDFVLNGDDWIANGRQRLATRCVEGSWFEFAGRRTGKLMDGTDEKRRADETGETGKQTVRNEWRESP